MNYEVQYQDFVTDKHGFFATVKTLDEARERAMAKQYDFLATNEALITKEFNLLFNRLREDDKNREYFWIYCYYCSIMLELFHEAHGDDDKAKEFLSLRNKIRVCYEEGAFPEDPIKQKYFIIYLAKKIKDGLIEILRTVMSLSKIKNKISLANLSRIYWFFCRTTITKSLLFARDTKFIDKMAKIFGKNIDVDKIIKILETPKPFTNAFSVGFLVARFIINAGILLQHTFFPSKEEKGLDLKHRFYKEIYARHAEFLNDIVWTMVNLITNYNHLFHLSEATAGWLLAGFLLFDFALVIWQLHLAEKEYLTKMSQLHNDLQYYQGQLRKNNLSDEERRQAEEHCCLLQEEIKQLEISWQAKRATFIFVATAALILMAGFSTSMLFSGPVTVIVCYAVCTFAMAMYLSSDAFYSFREKKLKLNQACVENKNIDAATAAYVKARNEFIFTLIQNAVIPTLVITTLTLYWPAAIVLAAVFVGWKLWEAYKEHAAEQSKAVLEKDKSEEEEFLNPQEDAPPILAAAC